MTVKFKKMGLMLLALAAAGCSVTGGPLGPSVGGGGPGACGFTSLGKIVCGSVGTGVTVIRDAAGWTSYLGASSCTPTAAPVDFSTNMIFAYVGSACPDSSLSMAFSNACLYTNRLDVDLAYSKKACMMIPPTCPACYCENTAISVSKTALPVYVTECKTITTMAGLHPPICNLRVY